MVQDEDLRHIDYHLVISQQSTINRIIYQQIVTYAALHKLIDADAAIRSVIDEHPICGGLDYKY